VGDSAAGSSREGGDLAALPPELARQSLSNGAIILPFEAAQQALDHLTRQGRRVECWEGWVKLHEGGRTRSLAHGGSFALPKDAARAAETAVAGMRRAQDTWQRHPEYPGASLYFELTFGAA
jgi:hypothetical protein